MNLKSVTFIINKLVRDNTIELCEKENIYCEYVIINDIEELKKLICLKLKEEAEELLTELNKAGNINEEFIDVIEVFNKLLLIMGISINFNHYLNKSLCYIKEKKSTIRGGFNKNIFLKTMTISRDHKLYNIFCKSYKRKNSN